MTVAKKPSNRLKFKWFLEWFQNTGEVEWLMWQPPFWDVTFVSGCHILITDRSSQWELGLSQDEAISAYIYVCLVALH